MPITFPTSHQMSMLIRRAAVPSLAQRPIVIYNRIDILGQVFDATDNISMRWLSIKAFTAAVRANPEPLFLNLAKLLCGIDEIPDWSVTNTTSFRTDHVNDLDIPFADLTAFTWTFQDAQYRFQTRADRGHTYTNPILFWWFSKNMNQHGDLYDSSDSSDNQYSTQDDTLPLDDNSAWVTVPGTQPPQFGPQTQPAQQVSSDMFNVLNSLEWRLLRLEGSRV